MEEIVQRSSMCFAIVSASSNKGRPERLAVAYRDENCLRDLIAGPSIVALGFASRDEATANLYSDLRDASVSNPKRAISAMLQAAQLSKWFGSVISLRVPRDGLWWAFEAFIAVFYSKNLVAALIRVMLGASF